MREQIAKFLWEIYSDEGESTEDFYEQADDIIKKFCKEIKKVENPYSEAKLASAEYYEGEGFYKACQAILKALEAE